MLEDKKFELYYCYYKDELVYIGQGKSGRHKHCLSGKSHCIELNKIVLTEGLDNLRIEVVYRANDRFKTLMREKEDIVGLQPKFNKDGKSRLDLLDNKKRKYPEDDVLILKYLHWRGLSAKSLKALFYFMWSSHVDAILDNSYYKSIKLPFLVNEKGRVVLIFGELEWFEDKYSSKIEKYCRMMSVKMKSELLDIGKGGANKVIKENRSFNDNVDEFNYSDKTSKKDVLKPVSYPPLLPSYYYEEDFSNNYVVKMLEEKKKLKEL